MSAVVTEEAYSELKVGRKMMGNHFDITINWDDKEEATELIETAYSEIKRIENLLTSYAPTSITAAINANAGIQPTQVPQEVFFLIERAQKISNITNGAFDLSYGSLDKSLWNFDKTMTSLPTKQQAKQMVQLINFRNIILDPKEQTVFLAKKGMRIGFGGIGKGYAADRAKYILEKNGVQSGIVNAAGDMMTWGNQLKAEAWKVGIANPDAPHIPFAYLDMNEVAIATSGNYEKYAMIDGIKYSHTINPSTGLPVTGIKSVTVVAPTAELADCFTTPILIKGVSQGLQLINSIKGIECLIITDDNKIFTSQNIKLTSN